MSPRILVVDDEPMVREVVERYLAREGFQVATAEDGHSALHTWRRWNPHLVVLDLMLPGVSGMEICLQMRRKVQTPVIMLTARGDEMDRIAGFENGADDYLAKPFSPRELVARVKAVLKRCNDGLAPERGIICKGNIELNCETRELRVGGEPVRVTTREFDLLRFFLANPGRVLGRQQLLRSVWDVDWPGDESTVTVHVRRLRTKIERDPQQPKHLQTVWGAGYKWED